MKLEHIKIGGYYLVNKEYWEEDEFGDEEQYFEEELVKVVSQSSWEDEIFYCVSSPFTSPWTDEVWCCNFIKQVSVNPDEEFE